MAKVLIYSDTQIPEIRDPPPVIIVTQHHKIYYYPIIPYCWKNILQPVTFHANCTKKNKREIKKIINHFIQHATVTYPPKKVI